MTASTRAPLLPDVPTVAESVPGFEVTTFAGLGVPRNTSNEIIETLNKAVNASLAVPAPRQRIADLGETASANSPDEFGR